VQAAARAVATAPPGAALVEETNGGTTVVPDSHTMRRLAAPFGATRLVPARRGALPNGAAAYAVHATPQGDLRWLTRTLSQRTPGNVPVQGPGDAAYFEQRGFEHSTRRWLQTR
jgi:hypothetical protein